MVISGILCVLSLILMFVFEHYKKEKIAIVFGILAIVFISIVACTEFDELDKEQSEYIHKSFELSKESNSRYDTIVISSDGRIIKHLNR